MGHMQPLLEAMSTDGEARWALQDQMAAKQPEPCKPRGCFSSSRKKIFLKIHGHKTRVKRLAEVKLRNFRGQGEGLGNKSRLTSRKMVEALENSRWKHTCSIAGAARLERN